MPLRLRIEHMPESSAYMLRGSATMMRRIKRKLECFELGFEGALRRQKWMVIDFALFSMFDTGIYSTYVCECSVITARYDVWLL